MRQLPQHFPKLKAWISGLHIHFYCSIVRSRFSESYMWQTKRSKVEIMQKEMGSGQPLSAYEHNTQLKMLATLIYFLNIDIIRTSYQRLYSPHLLTQLHQK